MLINAVLSTPQPAKFQKKQCGGVCIWLYNIAYWVPIQQKLTSPELPNFDFSCYIQIISGG